MFDFDFAPSIEVTVFLSFLLSVCYIFLSEEDGNFSMARPEVAILAGHGILLLRCVYQPDLVLQVW